MEKIMTHLTYIGVTLKKLVAGWHLKMFTGGFLAVTSFLFDSLQRDAMLALLVLIIMDFFSAILASYKCDEPISSARLFNTALKIAVYFALVSAGFISETAIGITIIDEILIGFLVVTELISILENVNKAGYPTPTGLLNILKDYKSKK